MNKTSEQAGYSNMSHCLFFLAAAAALSIAGCSPQSTDEKAERVGEEDQTSGEVKISRATARDLGLGVVEVRRKPMQATLVIPARLVPNQDREAIVGSLVQGRVNSVLVNAGDRVRKGQQLMLIEGLEIGEIKAAFIKAKAHLRFAEAAARRQRLLNEQNIGSDKALLEAEAELQKARAEFTAEDRKIHSVGLTDSDVEKFVEDDSEDVSSHVGGLLPIRAPLDGIVAERNVVQGQLVEATSNAFRIIDTGVLWADGQMRERDLQSRAVGGPATLTITALPERSFPGTVVFVSPVVDPQTRTVTVRAVIPNPGGLLKPNMFGELSLGTGPVRKALMIPENAVARDNDSAYVFVGVNDTLFARRRVHLGSTDNGEVEVTNGIDEGERVVANGSFLLKSELLKHEFGEEE
jgi:cobalt-zinc-cadmium efflux system membrane fusion protein